jgi:hypothetical protein
MTRVASASGGNAAALRPHNRPAGPEQRCHDASDGGVVIGSKGSTRE